MDRKGFLIRLGFAAVASIAGLKSFGETKKKKRRKDFGLEPELVNPESTSIFFVGDLQRYTKDTVFQPVAEMVFAWMLKRRGYLNSKCALFTGDFVENNEYFPKPNFYEDVRDSKGQWEFISKLFGRLDGKIPYITCPGNHDYGIQCFENRNTHFNEVFKEGRNPLTDGMLLGMFPNAFGKLTRENACYELNLGGKWGSVIVFTLEFCPRDEVLQMVHDKCVGDFADKKVFVLLHDHLRMDGSRTKKPKFDYVNVNPKPEFNGGEDVWNKLIKTTPNIRLVLNGHASKNTTPIDDNSFFRSDKNDAGKDVFSMVFAQHGRPYDGHGADGWVRVLEFDPDGETVRVSTFSPYLFMSMDSKARSRPKNEKNEFSFKIQ